MPSRASLNGSNGSALIQPTPRDATPATWRAADPLHVLLFALLGTYANLAAYGFQYLESSDYDLFLPLANWYRDPSLYPHDALRDVFPHMQTFYWPAVAMLSRHFATEHILFGLFLLTKLIFFAAVGLLITSRVRHRVPGACMVVALALSPVLNGQTPIGGTIILDEISEHAGLGLAIVLLAGVLLVQGRWRAAAIVAALSVYVDALHFLHMLPAFALFALVYWRKEKRQILIAAALGAAVFLPWYVHFHRSFLTNYPSDYVLALLINYPPHITLRWTPISQIFEAAVLLCTTACMCLFARKAAQRIAGPKIARLTIAGFKTERRLELLAASYFCVMLVGVLAGWFWLTPGIARFMLPRADSLLIPHAFLLIQLYGASLLDSPVDRRPATTSLLAVLAILSPLCNYAVILLLPVMIGWLAWQAPLEDRLVATLKRLWKFRLALPTSRIVAAFCALGILVSSFLLISSADQLWNFRIPPDPDQTACFDAQIWARDHTPQDAAFLVPPEGCGFRVISLRSTWGEWSDGNAMYFYPAFADTFLNRLSSFDQPPVPQGTGIADSLEELYKNQSWDRIQSVAHANQLQYILQVRTTRYPAQPVYANDSFAIYSAK